MGPERVLCVSALGPGAVGRRCPHCSHSKGSRPSIGENRFCASGFAEIWRVGGEGGTQSCWFICKKKKQGRTGFRQSSVTEGKASGVSNPTGP